MLGREYLWVDNLVGTLVGVIAGGWILDLEIDERLDQSETMVFSVPINAPSAEHLVEDVEIRWRDRRFKIRVAEKGRVGSVATIRVEADALWYELGEDVIPGSMFVPTASEGGSAIPEQEDVYGGLQLILAGSRWGGRAGSDGLRYVMEEQDLSRLALIRRWATITGRRPRFDTLTRIVYMDDVEGIDRPTSFRYGRNLESITRRSSPPRATVLYPYGRDNLTIAGLNGGLEYIEDFSYYTNQGLTLEQARARFTKRRVWREDRFIIDTNLLEAANRQILIDSLPVVEYQCKVVDLAALVDPDDAVGLRVGDTVRVFDEPLQLDTRIVVVRLVRYPLQPWRNIIELSSLPESVGDTSNSARPSLSMNWELFKSDSSLVTLRNNGSHILNRIALNFREGGQAIFGYDVNMVAVGTGSLSVSAIDTTTDTLLHQTLEIPYVNGQRIHENITWAAQDLIGPLDVRMRAIATATGGPFPSAGGNVEEDGSRLWILAHGAVQQTPVAPNSQRFDYLTDAPQLFTVPDDVTEMEIECVGAGVLFSGVATGGRGIRIVHTRTVIPGTSYDVYAPSRGDIGGTGIGGWPGGGDAGIGVFGQPSHGGGGYAAVVPAGQGLAQALVVAAGGGGNGAHEGGGDGQFIQGEDASPLSTQSGRGATQFAGGAGGTGPHGTGDPGSFGVGGAGHSVIGSWAVGGGGAGWYGGGGGGATNPDVRGGGGGGGSGMVDGDAFDVEVNDGFNQDNGYVIFRWGTPA